jgi:hypothetical protein
MAFKMVVDSIDDLAPEVAAEYIEKDGKFHIQVDGMKTQADVDKVSGSLRAARTEADGYKSKLALLGDRPIEDVVALIDRIPELELAAKGNLDQAKVDEIVETRLAAKVAPLQREVGTLKTQLGERDQKLASFEESDRARTLHRQVRIAAKDAGLLDGAVEDALLLADRTFQLGEDGIAVVKAGTPYSEGLTPKDWLSDLQSKRPHWWGPSEGGGAGGNRGGSGGAINNPFSDAHWNLTEQGKILNENRNRADQLAKAAGTTVGGARPAPKK